MIILAISNNCLRSNTFAELEQRDGFVWKVEGLSSILKEAKLRRMSVHEEFKEGWTVPGLKMFLN